MSTTWSRAVRLACRSGVMRRWVRRAKGRDVAIVMYHGIVSSPLPVYNWCHMAVAEFSRQMDFLAAAYRPLPLFEVVERWSTNRSLPDHTVCVTFDDGFRNIFTAAWPVLRQHQIPFTVFISTSLPDTAQPPWSEEVFWAVVSSDRTSLDFRGESLSLQTADGRARTYHAVMQVLKGLAPAERRQVQEAVVGSLIPGPARVPSDSPFATLRWDEIRKLSETGLAQFGSHTHTHEILTNCTPEQQREEMRVSRNILMDRLGYCDLLAYPNGDHSDSIRQAAKEAGYRGAVTAEHRLNPPSADAFALARIGAGAGWSPGRFETKMLGY